MQSQTANVPALKSTVPADLSLLAAHSSLQVLKGEANARLDLDKWLRKSRAGWVSNSIQGSREKSVSVCKAVCWVVWGTCTTMCMGAGVCASCERCGSSGSHPTTKNMWERKESDECVFTKRSCKSGSRKELTVSEVTEETLSSRNCYLSTQTIAQQRLCENCETRARKETQ